MKDIVISRERDQLLAQTRQMQDYMNKFKEVDNVLVIKAYLALVEDYLTSVDENNKLLERLCQEISGRHDENDSIQYVDYNRIINSIVDLGSKIDVLLEKISGKEGLIASSNTFKKRQENKDTNTRYIKDLSTDQLIKDYRSQGCKLTQSLVDYYNKKFGITYGGLRKRLIDAGAWKKT